MKSYVLNKTANKIEVYSTVYISKKEKPTFYSDSTLFIYLGSLPLNYNCFNTGHRQVEDCNTGDSSKSPYFGKRSIGGNFEVLNRQQVINIFKSKQKNACKPCVYSLNNTIK